MKIKETRIVLWIAVAVLCALGTGFYLFYKYERKTQINILNDQKYVFAQLINKRDSIINEWIVTFNQIEKDIQSIKEKENFISFKTSSGELPKDEKIQLLEDMKYVNTLIDANKKKIAALNEQLKKSGAMIMGLQEKIATLDSALEQNKQEISALKADLMRKDDRITQLDSTVDGIRVTIEQKNMVIVTQIDELNKAFVVTGTFKELKAKGLVAKTGGFIGLGKNKSLKTNFLDTLFSQVDIRTIKTISVNARFAKLLSEHPLGSYEAIYADKNKFDCIKITNPEQFWKISKYAVVEIKK